MVSLIEFHQTLKGIRERGENIDLSYCYEEGEHQLDDDNVDNLILAIENYYRTFSHRGVLKEIDLRGNKITDTGAHAIADLLNNLADSGFLVPVLLLGDNSISPDFFSDVPRLYPGMVNKISRQITLEETGLDFDEG